MKRIFVSTFAIVLVVLALLFAIRPTLVASGGPYFFTLNVRTALNNAGTLVQTGAVDSTSTMIYRPKHYQSVATRWTLPTGQLIYVYGTGKATTIAPSTEGRLVTLYAVSTDSLVDGGNLKLSANFYATADDMITLVQVDTFYVEIARSVN